MSEARTPSLSLRQGALAEFVGTAMLTAAVVGSGIMAAELFPGSVGGALLANSLATGGALVALILTFGPASGAHFNPLVTWLAWRGGRLDRSRALAYVAAQTAGALAGAIASHAMFGLALVQASTHARTGAPQWISEVVATFGLITVIARTRPSAAPYAVAAYIVAAYWFTASTSFANPALTLARATTNTFAGIRSVDVPAFVACQMAGAWLASKLGPRPSRPEAPPRDASESALWQVE